MIGLGIIWPLVPVMAVELGAGGIQIGLIIASFNIARSFSNPFVGRISDRLGRKRFVVAGLLLYALVSMLYVMVNSVETLVGVRLIHGFASVLVAPVAMALVADIAPRSKLGLFMGTMSMATMLGVGIGPVLGGIIKDLYGMDAAFNTMGGLAFATLAGVLIFIPDSIGNQDADHQGSNVVALKVLIRNRTFQALFLLRLFAAAGQGAVYTFLPLLALKIHMPSSQVGIVLGANIFLIAILQRLFGKIADRCNPAYLMIAGTFVSGLAVSGMPYAGGFIAILLLNCGMGIANGIAMPGGYVLAGRLGREYGMGSVMGLTDSAWSIGLIFSPIFSGLILDMLGMDSVFYLGGALILSGSIVVSLLFKSDFAADRK
jgi:MFS family permease